MHAIGLLLMLVMITGCTTEFDLHRESLREQIGTGRYDMAAYDLDQSSELYGERNRLLWALDRGATALALDDDETAIETLSEAESIMNARRELDPGEALATMVINDTVATYLGEPYEDLYVNVLKLLAQLEAGRLQGGATVEARRLAHKVDVLREEYLRLEDRAKRAEQSPYVRDAPRDVIATSESGEFIDSPLGTYLTAVTWMETGDFSNQAVAGRRLRQAIEAQGPLIGPVDPGPFSAIGTLAPRDVDLLVVTLSGRGPYKVSRRYGPIYIAQTPVYFELPELRTPPPSVASVRVIAVPEDPDAETRTFSLDLIEDFGSVAAENHRRKLPLIYFRTMARAAAKSFAMHQANRAVARSTQDNAGGAAIRLGAALGSLALMMLTEKADTRGWVSLPRQAHVGLVELSPGRHEITIEFLDGGGRVVHEAASRTVEIGAEDLTTVVEHYWR